MRKLGQIPITSSMIPTPFLSPFIFTSPGSYVPHEENPYLPAPGTDIIIDPAIIPIVPDALQLLPSPTPGTATIAVPEFPNIYTAFPDPGMLMPADPNAIFVPVPNLTIEEALLNNFFLQGGMSADLYAQVVQWSYDQKKRLYDQIVAGIIPFPIVPVMAEISVPGITATGEYLQINSPIVDQSGTPIGTADLPVDGGAGILAPADVTILSAGVGAPGIFQNLSGTQKWLLGGVVGLTVWSGMAALSGALGKNSKPAAA